VRDGRQVVHGKDPPEENGDSGTTARVLLLREGINVIMLSRSWQ
jgi:hypothetical protein